MITRLFAGLVPPWARVVGALALLAGAWAWHAHAVSAAHSAGVAEERERWRVVRAAEDAAARTLTDIRAATARAAAAAFEVQQARQEARDAKTAQTLREALARPLACPTGAPGAVGDVLVPAAAVRSLRDAGTAAVPGP